MPHLIVEYSRNVEPHIELDALLDTLHDAAAASGLFPLGGLRVRAFAAEHYRIADRHPDNGYVHVTALVGHGRPLDRRRRVAEQLFAALTQHLEPLFAERPLAISLNMQEFHPQLNLKRNNLHDYVEARRRGEPAPSPQPRGERASEPAPSPEPRGEQAEPARRSGQGVDAEGRGDRERT